MEYLIVLGVILVIVLLVKRSSIKESNQSYGGMQSKYSILIDSIISNPNVRIVKSTSMKVVLQSSSSGGVTTIRIVQGNGVVLINWMIESPAHGNHTLNWEYSEPADQNRIIQEMNDDVTVVNSRIMSSRF